MPRVGVRELKDRLSYYIRTVRGGKSVVVTVRGEPVARLVPIVRPDEGGLQEVEERIWELAAAGVLAWDGTALQLPEPAAENRTPKLLSDLVVEDRE